MKLQQIELSKSEINFENSEIKLDEFDLNFNDFSFDEQTKNITTKNIVEGFKEELSELNQAFKDRKDNADKKMALEGESAFYVTLVFENEETKKNWLIKHQLDSDLMFIPMKGD